MLFHIQSEVIDRALHLPQEESIIARIENVFRSHREGKHIALVDYLAGQRLLSADILSRIETGTLRNILARRAEIGGLKNRLSHYIEVRHGDSIDSGIEKRGNQTVVWISSAWLDDSLIAQSSVLLTENQTDAQLLEKICYAYLISDGIRGVRLSMELRGGGGSTIANEQEALGRLPRLSICIADGDLDCPSGSFGQTAAQLLDVGSRCPPFQSQFVITARELENLIPTSVFEDAFTRRGATSLASSLDRLRALEKHIQGDWRLFVDLKEGLCHCDIIQYKNTKGEAVWSFFERFFNSVQTNSKTKIKPCENPGRCSRDLACRAVVISGFGQQALAMVAKYTEEVSPHQLANRIQFAGREMLSRLCEQLFSWCCSYSRQRA